MRILVVEDQKKMAGFIRNGLTEGGYAVDVAESAAGAEAMTAANEYDLVILDVNLPDRNGFDAARRMRSDGFRAPILMLTALAGTRDKVNGLDAGADDYLTKPFAFDELAARVRALLRRRGESVDGRLRFSDIEMDIVSRKVTRNGQPILLTAKEFALLEYFLRNPGRPLSRTAIGEHVWDVHFDAGSNVIDVYVNMLRKKVDRPFGRRVLHTVVGVGYVLKED